MDVFRPNSHFCCFSFFVFFLVLFCFILFSGGLSKPTLRAVPKNVVTIGNEVTIICEDPSNAQEYPLYIKGYPDSQLTTSHQDTEEKDKIFISSIESHNAGQYSCFYKSPAGISEQSYTLELIVTGEKTFPEH